MLIGFTGYAGSGKSTAARHLVDAHAFTLVKMAGPLKAMLRVLGLGHAEIEGDRKDLPSPLLNGRTPRHAMQTLGTEWGRAYLGQDFWVNAAMSVAADILDEDGRVVIDDVRFENEAAAVRRFGGTVVLIQRPGVGPSNAHVSEAQDSQPDVVISNAGDMDDLRRMVDLYLKSLQEKETCA